MQEHAPFRTFRTPEEAQALATDLELLGFSPTIEDSRNYISSAFVGAGPEYFSVNLSSTDFVRAEAALEAEAEKEFAEIEKDYYLFGFTDDELLDVVYKPDEWNALDRRLAHKLLVERGHDVSAAAIPYVQQDRIETLAEPIQAKTWVVVVGFALAFVGGIIGVFIGHHLNTMKKTLPDGRRVYVYAPASRTHGMWIFLIGVSELLYVIYHYLANLSSRY